MKLVTAALILPAAIVLAIAAFETRVVYPLPTNQPTRGLVWDGRTFVSKTDFARWLHSRGSSYAIWARRHPVLAGIKPTPTRSKPSPQRLAARNLQAKEKGTAKGEKVGKKRSSNAGILLVALAIVAGLLAIVLIKRRPRPLLSSKQQLEDVVRRGAAVAEGGAHLTRRLAAETAHRSLELAAPATWSARRRRSEVAWYLATALFAAAVGVVVSVWLSGA
jgi:hypothetical protein